MFDDLNADPDQGRPKGNIQQPQAVLRCGPSNLPFTVGSRLRTAAWLKNLYGARPSRRAIDFRNTGIAMCAKFRYPAQIIFKFDFKFPF